MALIDIVRAGVAIIDSITSQGGLQADVVHRVWQSQTVAGSASYVDFTRRSILTMKQRQVKSPTGTMVTSVASVVFLDPTVTVNVKDLIRLPGDPQEFSFRGHAIINTDAFTPQSGPVLSEVFLG